MQKYYIAIETEKQINPEVFKLNMQEMFGESVNVDVSDYPFKDNFSHFKMNIYLYTVATLGAYYSPEDCKEIADTASSILVQDVTKTKEIILDVANQMFADKRRD